MKVPLVMLALAAALLGGCKGNCRQLTEKLCDCTANSNDRNLCLTQASSKEGAVADILTAEDERVCGELLPTCDCRLIDTPQGKVRCGLARPLPDGGI